MEREAEIEQKFEIDPGFTPSLATVGTWGEPRSFTLTATYLDTPEHALAAAGWSLRRREGGSDEGWHLKRPRGSEPGRLELRLPLADELPAALRAEASQIIGAAPLVPLATVRTERTETPLVVDGVPRALVALDRVTARAGARTETWRELEVELVTGADPALLSEVTAAMLAEGARPAAHASKASRILATRPTPTEGSAAAALLDYAGRQVGMLQAMDAGVRVDAPDAVHKARVATRRLRSLLTTFAPFWDAERTEPLREELRWLAALLGEPRDAEVLAEEFGDLFAELGPGTVADGVRSAVLGHLADRHRWGHAALVAAWDTRRARALRAALALLLAEPPLDARAAGPASDLLAGLEAAEARTERLAQKARRRPGELERWHRVRKAAKAVRYCTEALAEVLGSDGSARAARWEAVTEAFGTLQDAVVAAELIEELADATDATEDWAVLADIQTDRRTAALAEGRAALDAALTPTR